MFGNNSNQQNRLFPPAQQQQQQQQAPQQNKLFPPPQQQQQQQPPQPQQPSIFRNQQAPPQQMNQQPLPGLFANQQNQIQIQQQPVMQQENQIDAIFGANPLGANNNFQVPFGRMSSIQEPKKERQIPHHTGYVSEDHSTIQAYERYVMAQFRFQADEEIEAERQAAIESLIPGTLPYFHLYFLDVVKNKQPMSEWPQETKDLWKKFDDKHGQSTEFYEVETQLNVLNKLEKLPQAVDESTSDAQVDQIIDVVRYIQDHYLNGRYCPRPEMPPFMKEQAHLDSSSQSEDEGTHGRGESKSKLAERIVFSRADRLKSLQAEISKEENEVICADFGGYEEELDWSRTNTNYVYSTVTGLVNTTNSTSGNLEFYQITNPTLFERLAEFFAEKYRVFDATQKKKDKFKAPPNLFEKFTLQQLDIFQQALLDKGFKIGERDKTFVAAYFRKIFSDELSPEFQENLTNREKFDNVTKLYQYAKTKDLPKSLIRNLLHEMLLLTIKLDDYKEDLFREYLKFPLERNEHLIKDSVRKTNQKGERHLAKWNACLNNVQAQSNARFNHSGSNWNVSNDNDVIPKYLQYLCHNKYAGSLESFSEDFSEYFLKQIEKKVQVYLTDKGLMDMEDGFSAHEFKEIQDKVILRFKDTNRETFKVDEAVNLHLEIKNVPELVIRIFEFNTETYYKKTLKPFDTSINLHGMVPSIEKRESFKGTPKNKILSIEQVFPELKDKIGLFIVEFQGNGKQCRAVVKKGQLSLIHRSTPAGHIAYIIDIDKKICSSERTGVWIDKKFYPCNPAKNGQIFIPYGQREQQFSIIMIHGDFAQLGLFLRKTEQYQFKTFTHLVAESVLVGQEAKILIRPQLTINGRKASSKLLKNSKVTVTTRNYIKDSTTTKVFSNLKFSDDQDTIVSFQVPPNLASIDVEVQAQIQNVTRKVLETLDDHPSHIEIHHHAHSQQVNELYLRKPAESYFIYCLGRNGEPSVGKEVTVSILHSEDMIQMNNTLVTDKHGRIELGSLDKAISVTANLASGRTEIWQLKNHCEDQWTQPTDIHIVEGETVEIPVHFPLEEELKPYQAGLKMSRDGNLLQSLFSRIQIREGPSGNYQLLSLAGLEAGDYELKLNLSLMQRKTISITVHKGEYWEGNFILKKNNMIESSSQKNAIRLEEIVPSKGKEANSLDLSISLTNASDLSRVHLFTTQFMPAFTNSLRAELEKACEEEVSLTNFPFAIWKNIFENDHDIGDEIRYVLDRKNRPNLLGNTLEKPSLLTKKQFNRNTQTEEENLNRGTEYSKKDLSAKDRTSAVLEKQSVHARRGRKLAKGSSGESPKNQIKDYQNFLSCSPLQVYNLKPGEDGRVLAQLSEVNNYTQLFVVAMDKDSVVQRQLTISDLLNATGQEVQQPIPSRDLTITQAQDKEDTGLMDVRASEVLLASKSAHITDFTSSEIQLVDSAEKMIKVMEVMQAAHLNPEFGNSDDNNLRGLEKEVLVKWPELSREKKLSLAFKYFSHELNFFLLKKDRKFYDETILPLVKNKIEKTFLDLYLLANHSPAIYQPKLFAFLDSRVRNQSLNVFEVTLLIEQALGSPTYRKKAIALANSIIEEFECNIENVYYLSNGNIRSKIFDMILSISDMEEDKRIIEQPALAPAEVALDANQLDLLECEFNAASNVPLPEDDDLFGFDSSNAPPRSGGLFGSSHANNNASGGLFGGHAHNNNSNSGGGLFSRARNAPPVGGRNMMPQAQMIQPVQQQMQMQMPMPQAQMQMPMSSMMSNCLPMSQNIQGHSFGGFGGPPAPPPRAAPTGLMKKSNALFGDHDDDYSNIQHVRTKQLQEMNFKELDKTVEYVETHYFSKTTSKNFYNINRLLVDYLKYLLSEEAEKPFITDAFIDIPMRYAPIALALIALPFEAEKEEGKTHRFKSDGKRGIFIEAASNAVLFKKEIKEGKCSLQNDVMISHRYINLDTSKETKTNEFVQNQAYQCEVIMTNISPDNKEMTLLFQVPSGSLPLQKTKYIDSKQFSLSSYVTTKQTIQFYFPTNGKFFHPPSNISEEGTIVAKSKANELEVGKKKIISKVETFSDMMLTTPSEAGKKAKILEIMRTKKGALFTNRKFNFSLDFIMGLTYDDPRFFLDVFKVLDERMLLPPETLGLQVFVHLDYLLKNCKEDRALVVKYLKDYIEAKPKLRSYTQQPFSSLLLAKTEVEIFEKELRHLEYFPIVNQRAFQIGGQDSASALEGHGFKKILNVQFRKQYSHLLNAAIHLAFQEGGSKLKLPPKLLLQFSYYLQLQDRVQEAADLFSRISQADLETDGFEQQSQIAYDYMEAYFEFFEKASTFSELPTRERFPKAWKAVEKYKEFPIAHFKNKFTQIEKQLIEIDQVDEEVLRLQAQEDGEEIKADKGEELTEQEQSKLLSRAKKNEPVIYKIKTDSKTGTVKVEQSNIKKIVVKYYPIDAEILFSRSPFVKDEAHQFSFVKPQAKVTRDVKEDEHVVEIPMPEALKGKNMVVEVNSDDIQKFLTYYSSNLHVHVNAEFGELRVLDRASLKAMPKVYVKVYCQTNGGDELFFRDGFTDIRGKFEYASASGKSVSGIKKFSVLVSDPEKGQLIKEIKPPRV